MRDRLLADPEPTRRVIGLMAANGLPLQGQKAIVDKVLAEDKDEMVRMYATGMQEIAQMVAENPAATQPAPAGAGTPATGVTPKPDANPIPGGGNK
jgi:hypothetical protein